MKNKDSDRQPQPLNLTPKARRALAVTGLLLIDAFLGDRGRKLTRLGSVLLLPSEEQDQLAEALRKADASLCVPCQSGRHVEHQPYALCSCSCADTHQEKS